MSVPKQSKNNPIEIENKIIDSNLLAIISIPNSRHPTEISDIIKEYVQQIELMRILKTSLSKFYTIVIKFYNSNH